MEAPELCDNLKQGRSLYHCGVICSLDMLSTESEMLVAELQDVGVTNGMG